MCYSVQIKNEIKNKSTFRLASAILDNVSSAVAVVMFPGLFQWKLSKLIILVKYYNNPAQQCHALKLQVSKSFEVRSFVILYPYLRQHVVAELAMKRKSIFQNPVLVHHSPVWRRCMHLPAKLFSYTSDSMNASLRGFISLLLHCVLAFYSPLASAFESLIKHEQHFAQKLWHLINAKTYVKRKLIQKQRRGDNLRDYNWLRKIPVWIWKRKWPFIFQLPFWVKIKITIDTRTSVHFTSVSAMWTRLNNTVCPVRCLSDQPTTAVGDEAGVVRKWCQCSARQRV